MNTENVLEQTSEERDTSPPPRRHPVTTENTPEETIKRMRALPERAARLKEILRARRETHAS